MTHTILFRKATDALGPINNILSTDEFIESCAKVLRADGMKFQVGATDKVTIPYNSSGIYMLWADLSHWSRNNSKPWDKLLSEFLDEWDKPTEDISYFPKSCRARSKSTLGTCRQGDRLPFYIGKSEKVSERVDQHLYLEPQKKTYALKLNHRVDLLKDIKFEINWLPLETTKKTYFLVTQVETLLRERLLPIIGKQ